MITIPIEELLKDGGSVYKSVVLAAKRANEVSQGAPPLIKTTLTKPSTITLEEIRRKVVTYKVKGK